MPVRPRTAPALHVNPQLCEQAISLLRPDAFPNLERQKGFGEDMNLATILVRTYLRKVRQQGGAGICTLASAAWRSAVASYAVVSWLYLW